MSMDEPGEAVGSTSTPPGPPARPDVAETPPPKKPRRRWAVVALLTAMAVLAVAFVVYRFLGDRQFATAHDAYVAGDCQEALDGFSRVTGFYQYTASGNIDQAKREAAECRVFLAADRVPDDQYSEAARLFREFQTTYPRSPLNDLADENLGDIYAVWGDTLVAEKDYAGGVAQYVTAIEEFPNTPGAGAAEEAAAALAARALDRADGGQACDALAALKALDDRGFLADSSRAPLATAYYRCARNQFRSNNNSMAVDHLTALLREFSRSSLVSEARALRVDAYVDLYRGNARRDLGQPQRLGSAPSGRVVVEIQNSAPSRTELLLSGPGSKSIVVARCPGCQEYTSANEPQFCPEVGPTEEVTLTPGEYKVILRSPDDARTRAVYGVWNLTSGSRYFICNIVIQR